MYSQEVFDAAMIEIRRNLGSVDSLISRAIADVFSQAGINGQVSMQMLQFSIDVVEKQMIRPSVLFRPNLRQLPPGVWEASYHELKAIGQSPLEAMQNFDAKWEKK